MDCYDKEGKPISPEEYSRLHADGEYLRVDLTQIGPYTVSTVWLGLDHGFGRGPAVIFETMVFTSTAWNETRSRYDPEVEPLLDIDCRRYCTEEEATTGHEEVCLLIRATVQQLPNLEGSNADDHRG
jgi:hypothetical protein